MKNWIWLGLALTLLSACEKQVISTPKLEIEALCLGAYGCFTFEAHHQLVLNDSLSTPLAVQTNSSAAIYYAYFQQPFQLMPPTGLQADSTQELLFFTAENAELGTSAQKRIQLNFGPHSFLNQLELKMDGKKANLSLNSYSRGVLSFTLFNHSGENLGTQHLLVASDAFSQTVDLGFLETGMYIVQLNYGQESQAEKIIIP